MQSLVLYIQCTWFQLLTKDGIITVCIYTHNYGFELRRTDGVKAQVSVGNMRITQALKPNQLMQTILFSNYIQQRCLLQGRRSNEHKRTAKLNNNSCDYTFRPTRPSTAVIAALI